MTDDKKHHNQEEDRLDAPSLGEKTEKSSEAESSETEQLGNKVKQAEELTKRYLADYQNLQRRVQEEKSHWIAQANKELLLQLLPVLDTLMLAAKHINDKGLEISIDQFLKVLEAVGVKRIKTKDEKFDPKTMEAIGTSQGKKDTIVEETRAGFTLYESVLRSAQVIVGQS